MGSSLRITAQTLYVVRYKILATAVITSLISIIPGLLSSQSYSASAAIEIDPSFSIDKEYQRQAVYQTQGSNSIPVLDTANRMYLLSKHPTTIAATLSDAAVRSSLAKYFDVREEALIDLTLPHMPSGKTTNYNFTKKEVQLLSEFKHLFSINKVDAKNSLLLTATSNNAELSALLANKHARSLIEVTQQQWKAQQDAYVEFLEHKIKQSKNSLAHAGEKLLSEVDTKNGQKERARIEKRLNLINERLAAVLAVRVELQAASSQPAGSDVLYLNDKTLLQLFKDQAEIEQEYERMKSALGVKHPRLQQKVAELDSLKAAITARKNALQRALPNKLKALEKEETALREEIRKERIYLSNLSEPSFIYKVHGNEFETLKSTEEFWRKKHAQALINIKRTKPLANLSHPALVPQASNSRIDTSQCLSVFLYTSLFSSLVYVLIGLRKRRFDNKEQADVYLQVPTLGVIPEILTTTEEVSLLALPEKTFGGDLDQQSTKDPNVKSRGASESESYSQRNGNLPQIAKPRLLSRRVHLPSQNNLPPPAILSPKEAFRALRTELMLSQPSESSVLMVTSPTSGEGKTTICSNLAVTLSRAGYNTLLIHANLRKTGVGESILAQCPHAGLSEHLLGEAKAKDIISQTVLKNLFVVSTGNALLDSVDLLFSRKMQAFITQTRSLFDYVLIDAPSVLPWSDAKILARLSDVVSLVIDCHTTDKRLAREALKQLHESHAAVSGLILNRYSAETDFERYYGT